MSAVKVSLLCHIGGEFIREEGKDCYKGGNVRLMYVERTISHQELVKKLGEQCKQPTSSLILKYKHPDIEFGSSFISPLVIIEDDNDLSNMMEVYSSMTKPTIPFYVSSSRSSSQTNNVASHPIPWAATSAPSNIEGSGNQNNALTNSVRPGAKKQAVRTSKSSTSARRKDTEPRREPFSSENSTMMIDQPNGMPFGSASTGDLHGNALVPEGPDLHEIEDVGSDAIPLQSVSGGSLLKIGLEFESIDDFKRTLTEASLVENFAYKPVRTKRRCIIVKCPYEGCPWRLHASKVRGAAIIKIKKLNPVHTCSRNGLPHNHPNARASWIATFILNRLRENLDYKPKEIIADVFQQFGVKVSYHKAWRGREQALGIIHGSYEESMKALPAYCKEVERTNQKSVLRLKCDDRNNFQRLFIAFYASIHGFLNGCRPLLALKGTSIIGKHQSVLLLATSVDGNGDAFPVAYAIAESESSESWEWFLLLLRQAMEQDLGTPFASAFWLTVVSEEQEGIIKGVKASFPGAHHGFCVSEIVQRVAKYYNDESVKKYLWAAAQAYTRAEYDHLLGEIRKINIRAYEWIVANLNPRDWATSHFEGNRYHILSCKIGENFTSWISEARDMPILSIVQELHSKLIAHFSHQRELGKHMTVLTSKAEAYLRDKAKEALGFRVQAGSMGQRDVIDNREFRFTVNLSKQACTCYEYQIEGLPCTHALAVIQLDQLDPYQWCQPWFMADRFRIAYAEEIYPIPDRNNWNYEGVITVKPPIVKRKRGRRKGFNKEKVVSDIQTQCSVCKEKGHNKRTCSRQQSEILCFSDLS